jgi:hypothetical protein
MPIAPAGQSHNVCPFDASITVTADTYADLFDDELDNIAVALDSLSDF